MSGADRAVEQRLRELTITNELMRSLTSTLDLPAVLRLILDRIKMLTHAEGLSFLLHDPARAELVFAVAETLQRDTLAGTRLPFEGTAAGWVANKGRSLLLHDVSDGSGLSAAVDRQPNFVRRGLVAVPLRHQDGVFAVLEIVNRYDGLSFTADDVTALTTASRVLESGYEGSVGSVARELEARLAHVVGRVPAEAVVLLRCDRERGALEVQASRIVENGLVVGQRLRLDQGIAGWVARERQALRLDDAAADPRHDRAIESQTHLVPRNMLCVPVIGHGGVLGVIQVINRLDGEPFTDHDLRMAQTLADHAALAIANLSLYRQAQVAAITDDLTELGNTRHFNRALPEVLARSERVSLLVLDLDNFKAVVDTHGHLVGSQTIRQIGKLIGERIRPGDIAARFGGDEFVVILPDTDCDTASALAEELRLGIASMQRLEPAGIDISSVTASIGLATYPDHAATAEELFKAADAAMYRVKRAAKNALAVAG